MSEKKFKVGDKVRYINPIPHYLEDYIERGDECILSEITDCGYYVTKTCESLTIESDELELIESTDPRTAFLQELKELLTKYDARIVSGAKYEDTCWVEAYIGSELVASSEGKSVDFTADNIMNDDKE